DEQFAGAWGYQTEWASATEPGLGLQYLQQRYYDPAIGKFISPDPIGHDGGLNLYAYCENDPVQGVDPSGLDLLVVRGSMTNPPVPGGELAYQLARPRALARSRGANPPGAKIIELREPRKAEVMAWLMRAGPDDSFYFFGHGSI